MKKLLCVAFVIAVGLYLGYDMRQEKMKSVSVILLANVEALATDEIGSGYFRYSWREIVSQEENDCYVVTEYVDHVRCMSGGTEVCQPSDVPGTERMKKTDCPG